MRLLVTYCCHWDINSKKVSVDMKTSTQWLANLKKKYTPKPKCEHVITGTSCMSYIYQESSSKWITTLSGFKKWTCILAYVIQLQPKW